MNFQFMQDNRSSFPVKKICQVLNISQSGFYRKIKAPVSTRKRENERLKIRIKEICQQHNGMVVSPMVTADLYDVTERSSVSRPRVARLIQEMGLKCRTPRKFVAPTNSKHNNSVAPNILNRCFSQSAPDSAWVSDITYLPVGRKWLYLTVFIDLFARMVVGWELSDSLERH